MMQFKEIKDIVDNHKRMPQDVRPYELLTYYQLKELAVVQLKNVRTPEQIEDRFKQIRQEYAINMGAYERGEAACKRISEFFLKIEFACNNYKLNPNKDTADEMWRIVSCMDHVEKDEEVVNEDFV